MVKMKDWEPYFYERSKVPVYLSKVSPIEINAITLFCFVFSRGRISDRTRRHETIHFQQYLETFVIGFLVLYLLEFLVRLAVYRDGKKAYRMISFEQEAYRYDFDPRYLQTRKRFSWLPYLLRF